jgi:hypothetical protein
VAGADLRGQAPTADGWDSPRAVEIAALAVAARRHAYADSTLTHFRADAQGHIYFLGEFRGRREIVRADQVALDVRWQAPDRALQTIVGRRSETRLPTRIQYHIDHLSLVLDNFGDRIRLGDGDEVWNALHPAAPDAALEYQYRLADSLEIRTRDGTARVYRLEIRPRDEGRAGVVGSMFVDRATGAIARLRIGFTAASYRDPELESITLDLRSAYWEGRYWLPAEQDIEIRRSLSWLDFPLEGVIRTRIEVRGYDFVSDPEITLGAGERVAALPQVALDGFEDWDKPLYGGPVAPGERSDDDLGDVLREAGRLTERGALVGGDRWKLSLPNASAGMRARRAEGMLVGGGGRYRVDDLGGVGVWGGYAAGRERPEMSISVDRRLGSWDAEARADVHGLRDVGFPAASGVIQTLAVTFDGEDYGDPYFETGIGVALERRIAGATLAFGAGIRGHRSAAIAMRNVPIGPGLVRPLRPIDDGDLVSIDAALELPLGRALGSAWTLGAAAEAAHDAIGGFGFTRATLSIDVSRPGWESSWAWSSRLLIGVAGGELPAQRLFLLGGRATLPGYGFRAWGGDRIALWRGELSRSVVAPWVRIRLLGAAGVVDSGQPSASAAERFGVASSAGLRSTAGVGLGVFYDLVRIDLVRGLAGSPPEDPGRGDWELLVSLNPLLWQIL